MQVGLCRLRLLVQHLHDVVAAEVGGHQNYRITEVDFPAFAVAHKAPVKHLIEQVHHIAVGLFHFIQQHHAVRALAHRLSQNTALAVANVARRGTLELGHGVRLLVFGEVDGNQRLFAAIKRIGECERSFGFPCTARPRQQEDALRPVLRRQAGSGCTQALCHGAQRRVLAHHAFTEVLFEA